MARIYTTHRQRAAPRASALDRVRTVRKKKPYKILLEAVTQEKKKLRSVMTYRPDPPTGYMYVPLGNRDITEYCKEKCRERNLEAHIVSAKPKGKAPSEPPTDPENARIDTQRIGHHFPSEIVDEACERLGYDRFNKKTGKFFRSEDDFEHTQLARSLHIYGQRMQLHGRPATETQTKEQIRSGIMEVFPKIPEADLNSIVTHAFEEGTKRVGNAADLPLARRVQLAVGAYIRHQYTDYDAILKSGGSWLEARHKAQPASIAKMKEWRDEGESNETEETFREIIVLDDDDDDDDESATSDDTLSEGVERGRSLEIVSSRVDGRELQPDHHSGYAQGDVQGWKLVPERDIVPMRRRPLHAYANSPRDPTLLSGHREASRLPQSNASIPPTRSFEHERHPIDYRPVHREPPRAVPSPRYIYGNDGQLYNLQPLSDPRSRPQLVEYIPLPSSPHHQYRDAYMQPAPRVSRDDYRPTRPVPFPLSRRDSGEQDVVPSVEHDPEPLDSPKRMHEPQHRRQQAQRPAHSASYPGSPTNVGSPMKSSLPSPVGAIREDRQRRPQHRLYEEVAPPPPSMFARMHTRHSGDFHRQARAPTDTYAVESTSAGLRHPGAGSVAYATSAHPYVPAQHDRSYVPQSQPLREYARDPGYHPGTARYDLRRYEAVVGPRDRYT